MKICSLFLVILFLGALFTSPVESSWFKQSSRSFPHDVKTHRGLNRIYNDRVVSAQKVQRPLDNFLGKLGVKHHGVVLTTASGKRWLAHSGPGFGRSSDTVLVDSRHMSNRWSNLGPANYVGGRRSVSDFMKAGSTKPRYNLFNNNCYSSACRMMGVNRKRK